MTKYIDEHFLDEESEKMYYLWGSFFVCYTPYKENGVMFKSRYKDLVEIIKRESKSEHIVMEDNRNIVMEDNRNKSSYWIVAQGVPILRSRLAKLGLDLPKEKREFPKRINEKKLSHFVRGFFDAKASINVRKELTTTGIRFNHLFLLDLHQTFIKYAKAEGGGSKENYVSYGHNDSIKIHNFIYQDWDFIKKSGLYLPFKKQLFNTDYVADYFGCINILNRLKVIKTKKKIAKAKKLLAGGSLAKDVAEKLGYASYIGLNKSFRKITGLSPRQYQMQFKSIIRKRKFGKG
jgi:hypothetical protein